MILNIIKFIKFAICIPIYFKNKHKPNSLVYLICTGFMISTINDVSNFLDNSILNIISSLNEPKMNIEQPLSDDYLDNLLGVDDPDDYLDVLLDID